MDNDVLFSSFGRRYTNTFMLGGKIYVRKDSLEFSTVPKFHKKIISLKDIVYVDIYKNFFGNLIICFSTIDDTFFFGVYKYAYFLFYPKDTTLELYNVLLKEIKRVNPSWVPRKSFLKFPFFVSWFYSELSFSELDKINRKFS